MLSSRLFCPRCGAENNVRATNCFVCQQVLYTTRADTRPLLKRRYRIMSLVGKGGMGAVYKAADTELGHRLVAVKEMGLRGLNAQEEAEAIRNFKREAHMLASLQHAHLPRIYDHFMENGHWYLVMDFIAGETLESYLQRMPGYKLSLDEAVDYGIQLCTVLDYLHTQQPPIIFRDLKPANIMRASEGQLYLIDFGIARHFKPGQARDTIAFGSPGYAAPEQYGQAQTTPRTDIYNLGVILHQMLTGKNPAQTPFFFAPLSPEMEASGIQKLLGHMLSLQMHQRPFSANIVRKILQQIATHAPQSKALTLSIQAPAPLQIYTLSPSIGTLVSTYTEHNAGVSQIAWSPDGQQIASASYDGSVRVWSAFTARSVATYRQKRLKIFRYPHINALAWSPDGQEIAAASENNIVEIWNATNGKTRLTYRKHSDSVRSVAWSPDSKKIASASGNKTHLWNSRNGKNFTTHTLFNDEIQDVAWSPDGKHLATAGKLQIVHVFEVSAQIEFLAGTSYSNHIGCVESVAWASDGIRIASAADDKTIQIWNGLTGNHLLTYTAHDTIIKAISWSPDGKSIASAGHDGTIQLWDALSGNHLFTFQKHRGSVNTIAWSPDGRYIAAGGADSFIYIWQML